MPDRWQDFLARIHARTGLLSEAREQHWSVIRACAEDLAATATVDRLSLHEQFSLRARLYRSYNDLAKGYVALHQAEKLEARFEHLLTELRSKGIDVGGRA